MCDKPICLLFRAQSDPGVSPMAEDSQSSEKRASMQDWRSFPYFLLEDDSTGRLSKCLMPRMSAQHRAFQSTSVFSERIRAAEKCFDWCVGKEGASN